MSNCTVCGKEIAAGATQCSIKCLTEASRAGAQSAHKAKASFSKAIGNMFFAPTPKPNASEVSMLKVKHRWLRNRNLLVGSVVLSFNHDGIAVVQDIGHNRNDVDLAVRTGRGLIEYVTEEAAKASEPVKKEAPPKKIEAKEEKKEPEEAAAKVEVEKPAPKPEAEKPVAKKPPVGKKIPQKKVKPS